MSSTIKELKSGWGGKRPNAGRKPLPQKLKLVETLDGTISTSEVCEILAELIKAKNIRAIQLYFQYRFGMPKEQVEITQPEKINIPLVEFVHQPK